MLNKFSVQLEFFAGYEKRDLDLGKSRFSSVLRIY